MNDIKNVIPAKPFDSNSNEREIWRVIGSTDIDDKGTEHEIAHIDPFIFLDEARINTQIGTPFSKHPHMGLVAISYILQGQIKPWDNLHGHGQVYNSAGGVHYINAGRGIVHGEMAVESPEKLHWLQLWINPGVHNLPLPKASEQIISPDKIPVYQTDGVLIRIIIGEAYQLSSPVNSDWPMLYLHISIDPNTKFSLDCLPEGWRGFIYVLHGQGIFAKTIGKKRDCLELQNDDELLIANETSEEPLDFVLCVAKPHKRSFVKLLGHGGALVATHESLARDAMKEYESNPEQFGA